MLIGCETWDAPCNALGVCLAGTEPATRELDPAARAGSLIGSVEPVARRALAEVPFAPLVVGGGGGGIVGAKIWIFDVDK